MHELELRYDGGEPATYLVLQVPGLALACIGVGSEACWLAMALGEPGFLPEEERQAQRFMRRHGLDQQQFDGLHSACLAVFQAIVLEPPAGSVA